VSSLPIPIDVATPLRVHRFVMWRVGCDMIRLRGSVRVIYEHGEPHCVRDDSGVICLFNPVTKFTGQDERYRREMRERADIAEFVCKALKEADRLEEVSST